MSEPFPIWCTKWALSSGIEEATAWEFPGNPEWCVCASGRLKGAILQSGQWWRTKAEAIKEANKVLASALRSARARVEDLESVVFKESEDEGTCGSIGEGAGHDETGAQGQHEPAF